MTCQQACCSQLQLSVRRDAPPIVEALPAPSGRTCPDEIGAIIMDEGSSTGCAAPARPLITGRRRGPATPGKLPIRKALCGPAAAGSCQ